jgi:proteasome lid subunit RPN8/RPN11
MTLILTPQHVADIKQHGERAFPHECCGFLLGRREQGDNRVVDVRPAVNERGQEEQHNRFEISAYAAFQAEKAARKAGLDILGHYHSHPNGTTQWSSYDLEHGGTWPGASFTIVSVSQGKAGEVKSWTLADDRSKFVEEPIRIEQQE